jgi:ABC-type amino acid transport substrate-binding protein
MKAEEYLNEHPDAYEMKYYDGDTAIYQDIANKRITATLNDPVTAMLVAKIMGIEGQMVPVGETLWRDSHFPVCQDTEKGHKLSAIFDKHIEAMYKDGTLKKLRIELMGEEYEGDVENLEEFQHLAKRVN